MASAEHEPITGVWGQSPQRGSGADPLVRGSGERSPPEAESILVIGCPTEPANLAPFQKCSFELRYTQQSFTENSILCYGPLVSEFGGGAECMVPPTPSLGPVPPPATSPWLHRLCKSPFPCGDSVRHLIRGSLGSRESTSQTTSRSV